MFITPPTPLPESDHKMLILTNTLILIALLVIIELAGTGKAGKKTLRIFYPVACVFGLLVSYAVYVQFTNG